MRSILEKLATLWAVLGGLVLLSIVLVTTINVTAFALDRIARLSGGTVTALPGYEDYVRLAISAAALMFFPYCQLRRGHIAVDLFVKMTTPGVRRVLDLLSMAGMALLPAFLCYWLVLGMFETRSDGALSRVLGWPEWPFYLPGIVSLLLWSAIALEQVVTEIRDPKPHHG